MELWGYRIDSVLEWALLIVAVLICAVIYFYMVRFIRRYATGMMAGFILLVFGFGLILGPIFYLISNEVPSANQFVMGAAIAVGCITAIIGAFELTSFRDF